MMYVETEGAENARHSRKFSETGEEGAQDQVVGNKSSKGGRSQILQG